MKNNADLFKKYIQQNSKKEQSPFAGLAQDLKIKYRTSSATGNDMLDLLQQISSGAETDTLDGLKTRLVRLDKLREFLLQSELQGQEQKTVYTAYTKVQTAVRKRKDEYGKKHTILKEMLSDAGSNISQAAFQASEDIPQLRIAMVLGGGLFKYVKKAQEQKKQKLEQRNQELKKDAELYYERELLRGKNTRTQKGKLKKAPGGYKDPFVGIENTMVQEGVSAQYGDIGQNTRRRGSSGSSGLETKNDRLIRQIADDVRVVANYYKGKLIRDKDQRMDGLEADREKTRGVLGKDRFGNKDLNKDAESSSFLDRWMPAILGPSIWAALKGIPAMVKRLPSVLKSIPKVLKAAPTLMKSGILKFADLDLLNPTKYAEMPGKALNWVKSLPGKGMKGISNWWNETPSKLGTASASSIEKSVAKEAAEGVAKTGAKSLLKKIPGIGLLIGGGLALGRALDGDWTGAGLEVASGAASTLPGLGTAASLGIDGAILARDAGMFDGSPSSIVNDSESGPKAQAKKQLIRETLEAQSKADPGTTPAAIVPIAKIAKTSDLKEILQSDSNGLGFLFSLKGIDMADLLNAMLGQSGGFGAPGNGGGSSSSGGPRGSGGSKESNTGSLRGSPSQRMMPRAQPGPVEPGVPNGNLSSMQQGLVDALRAEGITDPTAIANVMAQAELESGWKPRSEEPSQYASSRNKYKGRGLIQLSGESNYKWMTKELAKRGVDADLVNNPDLANDPKLAQQIAAIFYKENVGAENMGNIQKVNAATGYHSGTNSGRKAGTGGANDMSRAKAAQKYEGMLKNPPSEGAKGDVIDPSSIKQTPQVMAKAMPTQDVLGNERNFDRENAIIEWHESNDPNKGTASEYLKKKGLVEAAGQSGNQVQNGGIEGVDYTVDPDNGEKVYFDAEYKQEMAKLSPAPAEPQMSESMKAVKERSEKVAVAQAAPAPAPGPINVHNDNRSSSGGSGDSSGNQDSGTARWRQSWEKANDIETA